jgi:hypothetical protein
VSYLDDLAQRGDLDELLRFATRLAHAGDWDELLRMRTMARAAGEPGHEIWPAAHRAAYLVALGAPAPLVAVVLDDDARFAPGPLPEVAASTRRWHELAPHLSPGPSTSVVAHERVVRGEVLDAIPEPSVLDLPPRLLAWEPAYPLTEYSIDHGARFAAPSVPHLEPVELPRPGAVVGDRDVTEALLALSDGWDRRLAVAVAGHGMQALAALAPQGPVGLVEVEADRALAWTAGLASGPHHGRGRGAAYGRFAVWWLLAALGGRLDDWPDVGDDLGAVAAGARWSVGIPGGQRPGRGHLLVVEDPAVDRAWALLVADLD